MRTTLTPTLFLIAALAASPLLADWDAGVSAFQDGRYAEAADAFRAYVARSPDAPQGHYMLGQSLLREDRASEALAALARAVELAPEDARYRLVLAQAQLKLGRAGEALATLADQDPAAVPAEMRASYGQLVATAATRGSGAAALATVRRALDADPSSKLLWQARGQLARESNDLDDAFESYRRAYELDPQDAGSGRAAVHAALELADDAEDDAKRGWYERAAELARETAAADPGADAFRLAGEAEMGAQRFAEALAWFEKAEAAAEIPDPILPYYRARCLIRLDRAADALALVDRTLARAPGAELRDRLLDARGAALRHLERFTEAADAYRRAGDVERAAEMERLARIDRQNDAWKADRKACLDKKLRLEALLAEYRELAATPDGRALRQEYEQHLEACKNHLG